jgi:UDP-2,4-diacetamido-2,4,6-trideoxy-beta-L-altropyranose hydrolase
MLESDVVISASGQTLHELAILGVPTISVCTSDNQKLNHMYYFNKGFLATQLYWDDPILLERIDNILFDLNDYHLRHRLSGKGKTLIDGEGLERIAQLLSF